MDELYNGYFIRSGAEPVPDSRDWKPTVEIRWGLTGKDQVKRWLGCDFPKGFATEKLAEIEGHLFARQWIDSARLDLKMGETVRRQRSVGLKGFNSILPPRT